MFISVENYLDFFSVNTYFSFFISNDSLDQSCAIILKRDWQIDIREEDHVKEDNALFSNAALRRFHASLVERNGAACYTSDRKHRRRPARRLPSEIQEGTIMALMTIGERLTELRKSRGLSQEELAEKLTLTRQTISKWELGQSSPDIEYVIELCDFFGISADYLLKGEEPPAKAPAAENETPPVLVFQPGEDEKKGLPFIFTRIGLLLMILGAFGIELLVIRSTSENWNFTVGYNVYTGFAGYLRSSFGAPMLWFIISVVAFAAGIALMIIGIIQKGRKK